MSQASAPILLENDHVSLSFDNHGHITALKNKATGFQFLTYPGLEDNWKIMVLGDGHPVYYILGREQAPADITCAEDRVTFTYRGLTSKGVTYNIDLDFGAYLAGDEARFEVIVANHHSH